jgi:hypothetical protein
MVYTTRKPHSRLSITLASALLALTLLLLTFVQAPVAYAQDGVPRDTRTWSDPNGGPDFTFSTVEIRNDCDATEDTIYTIGMRPGWTLQGSIVVRLPADPNPANAFTIINVNQTSSELDITVPYPPVSQWQNNGSNREIHVDVAIQVRDEGGFTVGWVGGDQVNAPGTLGPAGQDWDVYCEPDVLVTKTADPSSVISTTWEISKSVTPAVVNLFEGESTDVTYTVQVTPTTSVGDYRVFGSIDISNTSPISTVITSVTDNVSGPDGGPLPVTCPVALPHTLQFGEQVTCTYDAFLPNANQRVNQVVVTFNNAGLPGLARGEADVIFGPPTQSEGDPVFVTVDDTYNGGAPELLDAEVSTARTFTYTRTVTCSSDLDYVNGVATYTRANTARIVETEQSANATMTVNCYRPSVAKTVDPDFTRRFTWQIQKSASTELLELLDGESAPVTYTVTLTKSAPIDENFRVFGTITVLNPRPDAPLPLTGISDQLGNGQSAAVTCPSTTVPAGGSLVCTYDTPVPNNADGTNTATVTATTGIVYNSPIVPYTFVSLPPSETTLDSVTVTDTNPATGQPWVFESSGAQSYQLPFACVDVVYDENNLFQTFVDNTVEITQTGQQSTARVGLTCTLPQVVLTAFCDVDVPIWTVTAETSGAYVVEFVVSTDVQSAGLPTGSPENPVLNLNLVAGVPTDFSYDGIVNDLAEVRVLFEGEVVAQMMGGPAAELPCYTPTALPPTDEPNAPAANSIFLPAVIRPQQ